MTLILSARVSGENCASAFNDHFLQLILGGPMTAVGPFRDLRVKGLSSCLRAPIYPYVAPHTSKIHTLITLGNRHRTKPLVFKVRNCLPRGFDSHRPLHFPTSLRTRRDTGFGSTH